MKTKILVGVFALFMMKTAMPDETMLTLFDFNGGETAKQWQTVNDGVMGGVSDGKFRLTETKTMEFFGTLSLANNGGFASVRTKPKKLDLAKGDTLVARIRGDGREYMLNLYPARSQVAFSYRAALPTKKDQWIEVKIPLERFQATSFGRVVKNAGAVRPADVNALGFMLGDKRPGPFKLEIEWIKVERSKE